jgi:hypothetical protein
MHLHRPVLGSDFDSVDTLLRADHTELEFAKSFFNLLHGRGVTQNGQCHCRANGD